MRRALIAMLVSSFVACSGDGITGSSTVNGAYTLRSINGSSLPYTIAGSGSNKTEIIDDVITLYEGGTYAESGHSRVTVNGQVTTDTNTETGSYSLFGNSVTLRSSDGGRSRVTTIEANTMTIVDPGLTWTFSK